MTMLHPGTWWASTAESLGNTKSALCWTFFSGWLVALPATYNWFCHAAGEGAFLLYLLVWRIGKVYAHPTSTTHALSLGTEYLLRAEQALAFLWAPET